MVRFSQLPNEMISEVWGHIVEPIDVENFALVSKHIYALGKSFVEEHNQLKREYSFVETGPGTRASAPAFLLKDVLLRPRVALYVTHLSIGRCQRVWQDPDGHDDDDRVSYSKEWPRTSHAPYPDGDTALFIEAFRRVSFVPQKTVSKWIKWFKRGDEDPILSLLLLLLPKITTLTRKSRTEREPELYETIYHIGKAEERTFLTRLRTVILHFELSVNDEDLSQWMWLRAFTNLSPLKSIHLKHFGFDEEDLELVASEYFIPGSSNVTEMTFVESEVGAKTMFQLLESIRGLKRFVYVNPLEREGFTQFEPFWMRVALLAHAQHSLESLKILYPWSRELLGNFRDFTALRELETSIHLICWTSYDTVVDLLPASIEKLHLHIGDPALCPDELSLVTISALVGDLEKAKSQLLPNLRVLKLSFKHGIRHSQADKDDIESLKETCRDVGIELTIVVSQKHR